MAVVTWREGNEYPVPVLRRGVSVATFLEQVRAGTATAEEIDDFVERWHEGEGGESLREFLGFTVEEYGRWLREPGALYQIIGLGQQPRALERVAR